MIYSMTVSFNFSVLFNGLLRSDAKLVNNFVKSVLLTISNPTMMLVMASHLVQTVIDAAAVQYHVLQVVSHVQSFEILCSKRLDAILQSLSNVRGDVDDGV